jgi:hypothetical protein
MNASAYKLRNQPVVIPSSGLPAPIISYIEVERLWQLEEAYSYNHAGHRITVPATFRFDLASVPRLFWFLIAPFELSIAAPLIHDFLYEHKGDPPTGSMMPPKIYSRKEADRVFRDIMEKEAVAGWRRLPAYWAVRWFGWPAWIF